MPDPYDDYLLTLREAADLYRTDADAGGSAAVAATIEFLRMPTVEDRLRTPLLHVLGQLEDKRHGRAGNTKSGMDTVNMAAMAAVVTLATCTKMTVKEGAKLVADHIGLAHNPDVVKRLIQYRKNLLDKRGSRDAQRIYQSMVRQVKARPGRTPHDVLRLGLELLRDKMPGASASKVKYRGID
jgi:hypothetical protein